MADTRRAALEAAFAEHSKDETEAPEAPEVEAAPEAEEPVEADPAEQVEQEEAPASDDKGDKSRDEKGRFAPKATEEKSEKQPAAQKVEKAPKAAVQGAPPAKAAAPPAPKGPEVKPPQSLRAAAREAWSKAPAEMRPLLEDVARLEGEARRVLQENAGLRRQAGESGQFRQQIETNLRPFEGIFRAEGVDPLSGAMNLVQTYGALHYGAPADKARILAGLITRFSTVDHVNQALESGVQPGQQPPQYRTPAPQPQSDPRAIFREEFQTWQQQAVQTKAERDLDSFLATKPEFINDVWDDMQTIFEVEASRGRNPSYPEVYDRALKMNAEIQGVLGQRDAAAKAALPSATAPTARARAAAATVRTKPATAVGEQVDPKDRRALLEANLRKAAAR